MNETSDAEKSGAPGFSLRDRVAIVTGAGAGLGRSYALALATRGAKVLVNDLGSALDGVGGDTSPADMVVAEILEQGGQAAANYTSVATAAGGEEIVNHAIEVFGGIDIVVNNAGNMRLSSGLGVFGIYGADVYAAAKGGIGGLLTVLALEGERHGIKVNAVAPMARTRMSGDDLYSALPDEFVGSEHVAPVVEYFASDECAVTGDMWSVGAGSVSRLFSARTRGYFKHPGTFGRVTAEDLAAHLDEIQDVTAFTQPSDWLAEWDEVVQLFKTT